MIPNAETIRFLMKLIDTRQSGLLAEGIRE